MEKEVKVNGLTFVPFLSAAEIQAQVSRVAAEVRADLRTPDPVILCVLNGAFMFAADFVRELGVAEAKVMFVKYSSYEGTATTGCVKQIMGLTESVEGKEVIIVEDIVDTGLTACKMIADLKLRRPACVKFVTLLHKPESSTTGFRPDYAAFSIPPRFILGYGLDLDGKARGLADIYVIKEEAAACSSAQDTNSYTHKKDMLNLVILGAPGCGKGTQSAKLIDEYGLYHISTGEVLRDHIKRGTDLGKVADQYISKGQLIPDELMIGILDDVLEKNAKDAAGVVFDGFPRTIPQAEALEELLQRRGTKVHAVVGLEVPEEELMQRLIKRGQESGRADDNEATIKNRLDVYHKQTTPLKDYYTKQGKYLNINGMGVIDEIFESIADGIEKATGHVRRSKK